MQFFNPASKKIAGVASQIARQLVESGAGLHITALVNDENGEHSSASSVLVLRDFAQEMEEALVVGTKRYAFDLFALNQNTESSPAPWHV